MESLTRRRELADRLVRRSPHERLDALISAADAPARIAQTDALELYEIIHEVGLRDAIDLVLLATPEQLQIFADLDCWHRDHFEPARLRPWLEAYLALDDEPFQALYEGLDPEVLPLFLQEHITVWLPDEDGNAPEIVPDEETRPLEPSPCNTYWLQYSEDEELNRLCRALVSRLYDALGVEKGWLVFEACRWELRSQMEETAYHFRSARLEDYGFRRYEEALEVYAPLDPAQVRAEVRKLEGGDAAGVVMPATAQLTGLRLPRSLLERLTGSGAEGESLGAETFLERCMAALDEDAWMRVEQQLLTLANMAASADQIEPSEREAVAEHFVRSAGVLNIGLEFVAERNEARGIAALTRTPLRRIFSAGHALLLKLQTQARELIERGNLSVTEAPASLLGYEEQDLIDGLLRVRPLRSAATEVAFRCHAELEAAAKVLADIAFRELLFFGILGLQRAEIERVASIPQLVQGAEGMSFAKLLATLVLNAHLGGRERLQPFAPGELPRDRALIEAAFAGFDEARLVPAEHPGAAALRAAAIRFAAGVARSVLDELGDAPASLDPQMVGSVLALSTDPLD